MFKINNPYLFSNDGIDTYYKTAVRRYYPDETLNSHYITAERRYSQKECLVITETRLTAEVSSVTWFCEPAHEAPEYFYPSDIKTVLKKIKLLEKDNIRDRQVLKKLYEHWRAALILLLSYDNTPYNTLDDNTLLVIGKETHTKKVKGWDYSLIPNGNDPSASSSIIPFSWEDYECTIWLLKLLFKICSTCKFL